MKKLLLLIFFPLALNAQQIATKTDSLISTYHKQDLFTGNILVAQNGKILLSKSFGYANRQNKILNNTETTFRIGSVSKSFTAVIILQLQEKGLLKVEDKLNKYLPDFPKGDSITIANLLSNTSGIKDFIDIKGLYPWNKFSRYTEIIPVVAKEALLFAPGERFNYSSSNYLLLCAIAEKVTGKKFEQLLKDNITGKLKMNNTGMDFTGRKDPKKAIGYEASLKDFYTQSDSININVLFGAGGMYSTVTDLLKFDTGLKNGQLLSAQSRQQMFTINKQNYGYGMEITTLKDKTIVGHSGSINGFKANYFTLFDDDITFIVLANYGDVQTFELYEALKHIAVGDAIEKPKDHRFITLPEAELKKCEGEYAINEKMLISLKLEDGKLVANIGGEGGLILYPETKDDFYLRTKNAYIKLVRDENGTVNAIQVAKGTRTSTWKRKVI